MTCFFKENVRDALKITQSLAVSYFRWVKSHTAAAALRAEWASHIFVETVRFKLE